MADTMTAEEGAEAAWEAWCEAQPTLSGLTSEDVFTAGFRAGQEAERGECAKLADKGVIDYKIAEAIRARSNQ